MGFFAFAVQSEDGKLGMLLFGILPKALVWWNFYSLAQTVSIFHLQLQICEWVLLQGEGMGFMFK